jgi:hypothetical protein
VSTLTKVFVVLTTVFAVALSCLFIATAAQFDNYRKLANEYQSERDAAISKQESATASAQIAMALQDDALAARARDLADVQSKLQQASEENAKLHSDLSQTQNERTGFEAGRTKLQEILDVTMGELKSVQTQNRALLTQNVDLQTRNSRMNGRILELTTSVSILTDQTRNIQERLTACEQGSRAPRNASAAGQEAGSPRLSTPVAPGVSAVAPHTGGEIRGEVTEVDGNYASVNVGESAGVAAGMTFMIYRQGGSYVGDLVIERVRPNESSGKLQTVTQGAVQVGDQVAFGVAQ